MCNIGKPLISFARAAYLSTRNRDSSFHLQTSTGSQISTQPGGRNTSSCIKADRALTFKVTDAAVILQLSAPEVSMVSNLYVNFSALALADRDLFLFGFRIVLSV